MSTFLNGCGYIEPETMALKEENEIKATVLKKDLEPVKSQVTHRNNVGQVSQPSSYRTILPWAPVLHILLTY